MKYFRLGISFLLVLVSFNFLQAQVKIGIDANLSVPQSSIKNTSNSGFGGDVYLKYLFLMKHLSLGVKAGYLKFQSNSATNGTNVTLYPVRGNAEFYIFTKIIKPFVGADFGFYRVNLKESKVNGVASDSYYIGYAPLIGVSLGLVNHFDLNFTARFEQLYAPSDVPPSAIPYDKLSYVGFLGGVSFTF